MVSHMASRTLRPFTIYCVSPSEFQLFLIHPPQLSGSNSRDTSSEAGETRRDMSEKFAYKQLFQTVGIFNMP
jgi:hypothetical protein